MAEQKRDDLVIRRAAVLHLDVLNNFPLQWAVKQTLVYILLLCLSVINGQKLNVGNIKERK